MSEKDVGVNIIEEQVNAVSGPKQCRRVCLKHSQVIHR